MNCGVAVAEDAQLESQAGERYSSCFSEDAQLATEDAHGGCQSEKQPTETVDSALVEALEEAC